MRSGQLTEDSQPNFEHRFLLFLDFLEKLDKNPACVFVDLCAPVHLNNPPGDF